MTSSIKFTKSALATLIKSGQGATVKDSECSGLKFVIGKKRNRFVFEKRISGRKGAAITITIGAYPAISIDDARIEANRLANQCERGIDPRKPKVSAIVAGSVRLDVVLERFFIAKKGIASETMRNYRYLARFIPDEWLEMNMNAIKPGMIAELFYKIRERTHTKCWEFITLYGTIYNTCSPFFLNPDGERILRENPIPIVRSMLTGVKREPRDRPVIPANQLGRFVVTLEKIRDGEMVLPGVKRSASRVKHCNLSLLALFTGFRYKELQWLKWDYIDLDLGTIALPGVLVEESSDFKGTKNQQDHIIPLASYPLELLRSMHQFRDPVSPYVFFSEKGTGKPAARCKELFLKLSDFLGYRFTPHAARRTFASIADDLGLGFLSVKRMLNHHFEGGVTGGYIVKGFNPLKQKDNFQRVCDYILHSRAVYLGLDPKTETDHNPALALAELNRVASKFGLDLQKVLGLLADVA